MRNIGIPAGAPLLVIFYVANLFLTNFGLPMYLAYSLFLLYGSIYIFGRLYSGYGIKLTDKNVFFLHFLLLVYVITMYSLYTGGLLFRENIYWWNQNSTFKFLSILIASIAVIMTPIGNIVKSLTIIKNISYFIILGSFFFYLLTPFGENFFTSDALAGYRFNGGVNSYIITGQLLLAGFIAHFQLSKNNRPASVFMMLVLFSVAVFATKDRTTIISMFIIIAILFYRSGFGVSPFLFRMRKSIILVILIPVSVAFFAIQFQQINSGNLDAYKSTLNRIVISMRSYELFKHAFPLGAGPGSQTYLMYDQKIDVSMEDGNNQENILKDKLAQEIKNWEQRVRSGERNSPHNTYFEYLVPFGAMGLLFVISIWFIQLGSLKRLFFRKGSSTIFLDSFAVSSMIFFIFSSLSHLIWLYLIYYRMLIYQKNSKYRLA